MRSRKHRYAWLAVGLVLGLVFAMFVASPTVAAPLPNPVHWSSYTSVIGGTGTLANASATSVTDASGNIYIFYDRQVPGGGTGVYVMKYKDHGPGGPAPVAGFPVQVSTVQNVFPATTPSWAPLGAVDSSGTVYATWFSSNTIIYASKSTDGGLTWSVQVEVNPVYEEGNCFAPSIAVAPNGRLYVAWLLEHFTGAVYLYNISVAYSNDGGDTFSRALNVSGGTSPPGHWITHPSIAVDSHNRVHVVYSQFAAPGGLFPAWVNYTHSDDGITWSQPMTLNSGPIEGMNPRVVVDAQDRVYVVWVDGRTGYSGNLIYYRTSSDRGQTWSIELPVSQGQFTVGTGYYSANVNVATEGDTVLVVWDEGYPSLMGYAVSTDHGGTWQPENVLFTGGYGATLSVDGNGTYYAFGTDTSTTPTSVGFTWWHSPPSRPVATVAVSGNNPTVSWTAPPENDVLGYLVFRSNDGSTYNLVATVSAGTTSYTDSALGSGTYWYQVQAIDTYGYVGPASPSAIGVVGATISQLQSAIAALQQQLANANASSAANRAALEAQIAALQSQLTALQNAQATQTMSYVNLGFEILVVVLLAVILLMQLRRPKNPVQVLAPTPGQAVQRNPEDEL